MLKKYWYKADWSIMLPVGILLIIGIVMMFSTSSIVGVSNYNDAYFFIKRHILYMCLGGGACLIGVLIPYTVYKQWVGTLFIVSGLLLAATLTPLGVKIGGAQRWLNIGIIQFQPAEIVKFVAIICIGVGLERSHKILNQFFKGCVPMLAIVGLLLIGLVYQPDLGNIALILCVTCCLFFLSTIPLRHIIGLVSVSMMAIIGIIVTHPYQMQRIQSFLNPWQDPLGKNYHMVQSLIAIGSGGITGVGLGESKLKYFYLPLQYSDFIFSIICEEGGLILAVIVIMLYAVILYKAFQIAKQSNDQFGSYLGMGLALLICIQAFVNIAVVIGLLPVTGIPLTFISFGGTSLIMSLFYVGIILNISNSIQIKEYEIQ